MSFARWRLVIALAAFVGWLSWLGYAVAYNFWRKPDIVSRAQLTEADVLVVAAVTTDDAGKPKSQARVVTRLSQGGPVAGDEIAVDNLPSAQPPGKAFPGPGEYLIALNPVGADRKSFRIAGLPRSPGYPPTQFVRPVVYPWTTDVQKQLQSLGYSW
jgi:hypothetical protein